MIKKIKGRSKRRWPKLAGLLIAGTAVGAASALVMRRRRQQWEEYEPLRSVEPAHADFEPARADVTSAESAAAAADTADTADSRPTP